jgi:catechol 2,3-dioxygenase-like lactoylglutathione lyase family enzyme
MIGRMHHVVLDCPDPPALATFYSSLLGLPVTYQDDDWVVVAVNETTSGLAFQRAPGNRPSTWPDSEVPQQVHLDIMVEDPATAAPQVLAIGAVKLDGQDVYGDPAGHPFCLIRRPRWAPPISATPNTSRDSASD